MFYAFYISDIAFDIATVGTILYRFTHWLTKCRVQAL
jgi:hypothetical protein